MKLILSAVLIVISGAMAYAAEPSADADQQTCKIPAGYVYCMNGANAWDQGCEAKCDTGQTAVCAPASGWSDSQGGVNIPVCNLNPSECFCQ